MQQSVGVHYLGIRVTCVFRNAAAIGEKGGATSLIFLNGVSEAFTGVSIFEDSILHSCEFPETLLLRPQLMIAACRIQSEEHERCTGSSDRESSRE